MKTIAVICSTVHSSHMLSIRNAIIKQIGFPIHAHDAVEHSILFFAGEDAEDVHYQISQWLVHVFRPKEGHKAFVDLHGYFNEHVEIHLDTDEGLLRKYCPQEKLDSMGIYSFLVQGVA